MNSKTDLLKRAAELRDRRMYAETCKIYQTVLDDFGLDPDVMIALANAEYGLALRSSDPDMTHAANAIRWAEQAVALRPDEPSYHYTLGTLIEVAGVPDYEVAAREFRRAIELEPWYGPALANLANLYDVPDHVVPLSEAIYCCERALRIGPTRSLWLVLSRLYGYAGRTEDSERAFAQSLLEVHETQTIRY